MKKQAEEVKTKFIKRSIYPKDLTKERIMQDLKNQGYTDVRYSGNDGGFYVK